MSMLINIKTKKEGTMKTKTKIVIIVSNIIAAIITFSCLLMFYMNTNNNIIEIKSVVSLVFITSISYLLSTFAILMYANIKNEKITILKKELESLQNIKKQYENLYLFIKKLDIGASEEMEKGIERDIEKMENEIQETKEKIEKITKK